MSRRRHSSPWWGRKELIKSVKLSEPTLAYWKQVSSYSAYFLRSTATLLMFAKRLTSTSHLTNEDKILKLQSSWKMTCNSAFSKQILSWHPHPAPALLCSSVLNQSVSDSRFRVLTSSDVHCFKQSDPLRLRATFWLLKCALEVENRQSAITLERHFHSYPFIQMKPLLQKLTLMYFWVNCSQTSFKTLIQLTSWNVFLLVNKLFMQLWQPYLYASVLVLVSVVLCLFYSWIQAHMTNCLNL